MALLLAVALLHLAPAVARGQAPAPAAPVASPIAPADIVAKADEYLHAHQRLEGFRGAVLVAHKGQPVLSKGYGPANAEWGISNTPQTKFRLGSITKQFTAALILRLQEQGKLKVQDPICTYVALCPESWAPVTIHHLLTHTSGIPSYTDGPDYVKQMMMPRTVEDMVAGFRDRPLAFTPGSQFKYNNSGYFLLGVIIEKVVGAKYEDVLRTEIFEPLGMKDSGYDWPVTVLPRRANGYTRAGGDIVNAAYLEMTQPYAAGALYSTVEDLLIWDQALYGDRVLPARARDAMFTPFLGNYAYGWAVLEPSPRTFGKKEVGHGGGINGFATMIRRFPEDNVTVIVLSNLQTAPAGAIARDLQAIVYGQPYKLPVERQAVTLAPTILERYVGKYAISPEFVMTVTREGGQLMTQATGQQRLEVYAESETKFFLRVVDAQLTFHSTPDGTVTHLVLHQNGRDVEAKKIE